MKAIVRNLCYLTLLFLWTFTILGFIGSNWVFDLFSHFQYQYCILAILIIIYFGSNKKWIACVFALICFGLNAKDIVPLYSKINTESGQRTIKLTSINLLSSNGEFSKVHRYIKHQDPDILILQELNELWLIALDTSLQTFEFQHSIPRRDNFGIGIYSKLPINDVKEVVLNEYSLPSIFVKLKGDNVFQLLATHPLPPVGKEQFEARNDQFAKITQLAKDQNKYPLVVIGDLNSSSFSRYFKKLVRESNLKDSRNGFGVQPTWPSNLSIVRTTLDHCLISKEFEVHNRKVGTHLGSDHYPISLEVSLNTQ